MGGRVNGGEEGDLVALGFEELCNFKGDAGSQRVSGDGVWAVGLSFLHVRVVHLCDLSDAVEERFAGIDASCAKTIDWAI